MDICIPYIGIALTGINLALMQNLLDPTKYVGYEKELCLISFVLRRRIGLFDG